MLETYQTILLLMIEGAIKPLRDDIVELSTTNVDVKTGGSWVGGPELCVKGGW